MDDKIKDYLKRSAAEVAELKEKVEEFIDDIDQDDVRRSVNQRLEKISGKLKEALESGETLSDTAQLKAHLGAMEAKDMIHCSREVFDDYLDKGARVADEAELKAALAKMEAEDFWEERGPALKQEFSESTEKMKEITGNAVDEIRDQITKWRSKIS